MIFNNQQPIYIQIISLIYLKILKNEWIEEERIPSVRDMATSYGINPNTVMRAYEKLQLKGIIYNTRGMGHSLAKDAKKQVKQEQKEEFECNELPKIFERMTSLGTTIDDIEQLYDKWLNK